MKKFSKIILIFGVLCSLIILLCFTVSAESYKSGMFTYDVQDGKALITKVNTTVSGNLDIPSTLGGYPVESIEYHAFNDCDSLVSVTIPDSVKNIKYYAFMECAELTSVVVGNGVEDIGMYAFCRCSKLTEVTLGNQVKRLGDGAFYECNNLKSINLPDSLLTIGKETFYRCKNLSKLKFGNSLVSIDDNAFYACSKITNITLPDSLISLGNGVFSSSGLQTVYFGDKIKTIGNDVFKNCEMFKRVTFPDSVESIGTGTFYGCNYLETVVLPKYLSVISDEFFMYCQTLVSVTMPESLTRIGDFAFWQCFSIEEIILPEGLISIGNSAFDGSGLRNIIIPESVVSIGSRAFAQCYHLSNITISDKVEYIGTATFTETYVYNSSNWENNLLYFKCYLLDAKEDASGDVVVKEGTKVVAGSAFAKCTKITKVSLPDSVITIGYNVFYWCPELREVILSNNISKIYDEVFYHCSSLQNIIIPSGVTYIGDSVFYDCTNLKYIHIPQTVTEIKYLGDLKNTIICSETDNCFAKTYADNNNMSFIKCTEHEKKKYLINYNLNGGTEGPTNQTKIEDKSLTIATETPIKKGFIFLGWSKSSNATKIDYIAGSQYTDNSDVTLYAVWKQKSYIISYKSNGGGLVPADQTKMYDVQICISNVIPKRDGYIFLGWSKSKNATYSDYGPGEVYSDNADVVLYAIWKKMEPSDYPTAESIINVATPQTIDYKTKVVIVATALNVPDDFCLALYINGKEVSRGNNKEVSYEYGEIKSNINYSVKIIDSNGIVQRDNTDSELIKDGGKITCKSGFVQKLVAFFKGLFGSLPTKELRP